MGISVGIVGLGQFGSVFVPLFKAHPFVDRIALCDMEPERVKRFAEDPFIKEKLSEKDLYYSFDDICKSDIDAIAIFTQPWLHAPQAVKAMEKGKHVYSAVPIISLPDGDEILQWCDKLVKTSEKTGKFYMLGETSYYHPESMFCRRKVKEGEFGNIVYAEGEYFHDVDSSCNLRVVNEKRTSTKSGKEYLKILKKYAERGIKTGPMHYPTHSVRGLFSIIGSRAEKVTGYGYKNQNNDPYFKTYNYEFSNEVALVKMNNGAVVRLIEFREVAGSIADSETFRIFGTKGSYAEKRWMYNGRDNPPAPHLLETIILTDEKMRDPLPEEVKNAFKKVMYRDKTEIELQNIDFVPTGHKGSHPYLVNEFVSAVYEERKPAIDAKVAAHWMAVGVMAHKSALKDGETLKVPHW